MTNSKPSSQPKVLCLMGPTAAGKTQLAVELSKKIPCRLISVDSAQVYRGLDICSGKLSPAELKQYPHDLIDILEPSVPYSAFQFREDALALIEKAHHEGKLPVLVGGTMLYFKALTQGMAQLPAADADLRLKIEEQANEHGWESMHQALAEVDSITAKRLEPNDAQRISRALEVYHLTGVPLSSLIKAQANQKLPYNFINVALMPKDDERFRLHAQIEKRFKEMLEQGLIDEVKGLLVDEKNDPQLPAFKSVGLRQVIEHLRGDYDYETLIDKGIVATRQLAKRQLTWLRGWPDCEVIDCFAPDRLDKLLSQVS